MHHEVSLITTVAIGFVLAFAFGYLADRLRLPPLVGYLFAGIVAGPSTAGMISDIAIANQLAEMGVILLMFGVGLHFSASDLLAVGRVAIPGAIAQIVIATLLGAGLAVLWGWSFGAGLVLGLSLSVASTVVLLKALEERNLVETADGRIAVGWLIVEDLAMVVALVLLPAFAEALGGSGAAAHAADEAPLALTLAITIGKVVAFAAISVAIGPKVVPWVLGHVARTGSRELFTLSVLAIALGIAYGSSKVFGVSFALGAFFAGLVLAESRFSHKAAAESLPLQDAFSVLFFVSVGMLFDPSILIREPLEVICVVALIMLGKAAIAFLVVTALRFPVPTGLFVAASLAQIGEFSFILVALGLGLGVLPTEATNLVLAGALLSITLNPLAFMVADALARHWRTDHPRAAFGRERYHALEGELARNRQRGEEREKAHALEIQALLDTFPLLALIDERDREELMLLFRPRSAPPGQRVIRRGDRADGMYFISSGAVEVKVARRTIRLEAGAFFGEMALLSGSRRSADVTAVDYCQFLVLERRDFNVFMGRHPGLRAAVNEMANQRRAMNEQGGEQGGEQGDDDPGAASVAT